MTGIEEKTKGVSNAFLPGLLNYEFSRQTSLSLMCLEDYSDVVRVESRLQ